MLKMGIEAQYVPVEDRGLPTGSSHVAGPATWMRSARHRPTDRITERDRPESDTAFVDLVQSLVGAAG